MKLHHIMSLLLTAVLMTSCADVLDGFTIVERTGPIVVDRSQDLKYIDVDKNATAPFSGWIITDAKLARIMDQLGECQK